MTTDLDNPQLYINREISLLGFNHRVLELAQDEDIPLLERLRFLCISSSNLDEFFEVRVAGVKQQIKLDLEQNGPDGIPPKELDNEISLHAHKLVNHQYELLNKTLIPALSKEGIHFVRRTQWNEEQKNWLSTYFDENLAPLLTPIGLDPAHPFPPVINKSLNFIVSLKGKDAFGREGNKAIVPAPRSLPRLVHLPEDMAGGSTTSFVFLSSIMHAFIDRLFHGMTVKGCYQFRVTRNSNMFVDEEEIDDLLKALQGELPQRNYGDAVRLEVADDCPGEDSDFLLQHFNLSYHDLYRVHGPVNLNRLAQTIDLANRNDLQFDPFIPKNPVPHWGEDECPFETISKKDILVHHPFQSFRPIIEFVRQAARDPNVLAIKQTLYRTGRNAELVKHLIEAAQKGKEVTAVIELRARFDEANNIELVNELKKASVHIVYGVVGYKTHAKLCMVVRREKGKIKHYVHMGTGNYHAGTAKAYTDYGLFTSHPEICEDVRNIFQLLTGLGKTSNLHHVLEAPFSLHKEIVKKIEREIEHAKAGKTAHIMGRMNALIEPKIIRALYQASQAGVKIELIVRGVCCLRPGIAGISENIHIRSVMGRFLEHPRIFYFANDNDEELYCSSADWMPRNFFRRVETAFPILKKSLRNRIKNEALNNYMQDNTQAWVLQEDGTYQRQHPLDDEDPHSAQLVLVDQLSYQKP
jgi:polyphosphate kinase